MARVIVIGGIESTYRNAQVLHELGEEIVMFYTRSAQTPGWEGVDMIDESRYPFAASVPKTLVQGSINDHVQEMVALQPDVIYSLGWQQIYGSELLGVCPVIGIHESLLPAGAGAVPLANAILNDFEQTGCTLFWLDGGMDTGPIIGQLKMQHSPQTANATQLYEEGMEIGADLLRMYVPHINSGRAPAIAQDLTQRTVFGKVCWQDWPQERLNRARVYPYT
ncbi:formyltransferase family protein [Magnetococcus sp. PR-3]|uniref:formyltransferase family protein n=1 Tax=Magnetococcus sp. PR-3 TaxID=3120355 RepID=UPI002FCE5E25